MNCTTMNCTALSILLGRKVNRANSEFEALAGSGVPSSQDLSPYRDRGSKKITSPSRGIVRERNSIACRSELAQSTA